MDKIISPMIVARDDGDMTMTLIAHTLAHMVEGTTRDLRDVEKSIRRICDNAVNFGGLKAVQEPERCCEECKYLYKGDGICIAAKLETRITRNMRFIAELRAAVTLGPLMKAIEEETSCLFDDAERHAKEKESAGKLPVKYSDFAGRVKEEGE